MTNFRKGADGRSFGAVCESSGRLICESSGFSFWKPKEKHFPVIFWRILSPGAPHSHPSHFSLSAAKRYVSQQIKNYRDFIKTSKVVNRVSWSPRLSKRKSVVISATRNGKLSTCCCGRTAVRTFATTTTHIFLCNFAAFVVFARPRTCSGDWQTVSGEDFAREC